MRYSISYFLQKHCNDGILDSLFYHTSCTTTTKWMELLLLGKETNQQKLPAIVSRWIDLTSTIMHKKTLLDIREKVYPGRRRQTFSKEGANISHPLMELVGNRGNLILSEAFIGEDCFRPPASRVCCIAACLLLLALVDMVAFAYLSFWRDTKKTLCLL